MLWQDSVEPRKSLRADRLLRLVRLLSDGRRRTLPAVADALEVSERTAVRDLDALRVAGVPVRVARGRYGGVSLPREWSRLGTGLTADEVIPVAALGTPRDSSVQSTLTTALNKIVAGLPAVQRIQAEAARQRLLLDPTAWWADPSPAPHLDALREAVWSDRRVHLSYRDAEGRPSVREVDPLALVLKAERWHVVGLTAAGLRVFRCDRIVEVVGTETTFVRPPDFDLPAEWRRWCARFEATRPSYPVRLRLTERGRAMLVEQRPPAERSAIVAAEEPEVDFQRFDVAVATLASLGPEARVVGPGEAVDAFAALARAWLPDGSEAGSTGALRTGGTPRPRRPRRPGSSRPRR